MTLCVTPMEDWSCACSSEARLGFPGPTSAHATHIYLRGIFQCMSSFPHNGLRYLLSIRFLSSYLSGYSRTSSSALSHMQSHYSLGAFYPFAVELSSAFFNRSSSSYCILSVGFSTVLISLVSLVPYPGLSVHSVSVSKL